MNEPVTDSIRRWPTQAELAEEMRALGQSILNAMVDPTLFGPHFTPQDSWGSWRVAIKAMFALPLNKEEAELFREATGRTSEFAEPSPECWMLCGRRSGKSRILSLIAVCAAMFRDYSPFLAPGETPHILVLARDKLQALTIFGYIKALFLQTPRIRSMLAKKPGVEVLELKNGIIISVLASEDAGVRGRTTVCALSDEIGYWESATSRNPAAAVLEAVRDTQGTIPGALFLTASSVNSTFGALYDAYVAYHGRDDSDIMIWKSTT